MLSGSTQKFVDTELYWSACQQPEGLLVTLGIWLRHEVGSEPAGASSASLRAATWGSKSASDKIVKELSAPTKPTVQLVAVRSPSDMLAEIACTHQHAFGCPDNQAA